MVIPGLIGGFLMGGGVSLGIFMIVASIFSCIAYFPFFKILDIQAIKHEKDKLEEKKTK